MEPVGLELNMAERQRDSLTRVVAEKSDQLRNFIRKRINNLSIVDDVLQDVFAQLVNVYEDINSLDAWLYTVARNKVNDYYRKKKPELMEEVIPSDENGENVLLGLLPSATDNPEDLYLRELIWTQINDALALLPEEQKDAFEMHEMRGFSIKEIAEIQGVTVNTVLSRKRYAVIALKGKLEEFYNENFRER